MKIVEAGPPVTRRQVRIAPSQRLILVVAVVLLPVAVAAMVAPLAERLFLLSGLLLALVAVIDTAMGLGHAAGLSASMPPKARLALGRPGQLEARLAWESGSRADVRVALQAPAALGVEAGEALVSWREQRVGMRVAWPVRPRRRGVYRLCRLHLERASPLGLWLVRWEVPVNGEARVYPDLSGAGRRMAGLFLRRPAAGWRVQRQMGRGRDFEKLREYLPGDGFDEIHWKATAKRGHPVTKVFQVERTQEIYAIVDASRLSGRPAGTRAPAESEFGAVREEPVDDTLLERAVGAALMLGLAAQRQGDLFGLVCYADRPRVLLRARSGAAHFQSCREALVGLQPTEASPDFREVATFLHSRLTKRSLLVFFTSLDDPALAEAFCASVGLLAGRHVVLVVTPLPVDARPLFSAPPPEILHGLYGQLAGHIRWQGLQELGKLLHRRGVHLALCGRDELAVSAVSQYMALKQRQTI